ncbi:hypothetical protein O3V59_19050 [Brevibacillus thermoruber]|uniref:Uncharacterized protein n=1 Tax=Brevibacillus thermoruber TaxID=33942 RepID=A0A9X3TSV9_9BACL|nr:hypothetical protein [Brevibacillus thermoruber]MDA5110452.1 hypothetical protein [Brevibacillus thermoruber]
MYLFIDIPDRRCFREKKTIIITLLIAVMALSVGMLTRLYFDRERAFEDKPRIPKVVSGNTMINVKQASYCWTGGCADTIGLPALLKGVTPTKVRPNQELFIMFDDQPQPTQIFVKRLVSNQWVGDEAVDGSFFAPDMPGVYYYSIFARWLDNQENTIGEAAYAFVIEI